MKVWKLLKSTVYLIAIACISISCGDELGGILNEDEAPSAGLITESGFVVGSENLEVGESFKVKLNASSGTSNLRSVGITEDGVLVDPIRIAVDGAAIVGNPIIVTSFDQSGFTWEIEVDAHEDVSVKDYKFSVLDDANLENSVTVSISTMDTPVPPALVYNGATDISAPPGTIINIPLDVAAGNSKISHVAVSEGADFITDLSRLYYGDTNTNFTDNPHPLPAEDQDGFQKEIFIKTSTDPGTKSYRVFIVDGNSDGAFVDFTITTGTPAVLMEGILFNAAGVEGTGGLDLDNGIDTGSRDPIAEIKDEGIDLDLPVGQNWKQQISGVNGSEVRYLIAGENGLPEGFSFDVVTIQEEIANAFGNGMQFDLSNGDDESISYQLSVDDVLVVKNEEKYYLIRIAAINVFADNNKDNYVIDIKK